MGTPQSGTAAAMKQETADRISNALIIKNIPAKRLAEHTDLSYKQVLASVKGDRSLSIEEFLQIADTIDVKPSSLLPDIRASRSAA
jgi:plasmid maintenance system antidote protein VapI